MANGRERIKSFMEVAKSFCDLCEHAGELGQTFFVELSHTLPRLQAAAALLPSVEPVSDHPIFTVEESLQIRLPSPAWDLVREVDWEGKVQPELLEYVVDGHKSWVATADHLIDGLDDIYGDVKEGFEILRAGYPLNEAVWEWEFSFWSHWAYHIAEVQRVIQIYAALYLGRPTGSGWHLEGDDAPEPSNDG